MTSLSLAACPDVMVARTSSALTDAHLAHVVGPAGELFPQATAPLSFLHCMRDSFLRLPSDVSHSSSLMSSWHNDKNSQTDVISALTKARDMGPSWLVSLKTLSNRCLMEVSNESDGTSSALLGENMLDSSSPVVFVIKPFCWRR